MNFKVLNPVEPTFKDRLNINKYMSGIDKCYEEKAGYENVMGEVDMCGIILDRLVREAVSEEGLFDQKS